MPVSITVEPLTSDLRERSGRQADPNHLAVVHSQRLGELVAVVSTTDDHDDAYRQAREFAPTVEGQVLTGSSYRPTVVGHDVAALMIADPRYQPTETKRFHTKPTDPAATTPDPDTGYGVWDAALGKWLVTGTSKKLADDETEAAEEFAAEGIDVYEV